MYALLALAAVCLLAALAATPSGARASGAQAAAGSCVKATNIEAIIDDSGSMADTDPSTLRVKGLKLLINTLSPGTLLGAVEFGSSFDPTVPSADTVFAPEAVGANATAMETALDQKILADNGGTDYNAAFAQSDADNPNANARIFLTDGGHNVGDYANGHLVHKVPTYVIGFSNAALDPQSGGRLQAIANDTGGRYFAETDSSQLQSVMNTIGAALTCQTPPQNFTDHLAQGASKVHTVAIGANTKAIQMVLSWGSPLDKFQASGLKLIAHGRTIAARVHHKVKKLRIKTKKSPTFEVLTVSHLKKGKLKFKVKATKVGSGFGKVTLTTQVSQTHAK